MTENLAHGYSSESTQQELSNEYQHDRVWMIYKNLCILVLWTKVASALKGLKPFTLKSFSRNIVCYFHTFRNNLGIKQKIAKYFKESCCLYSDQHFSFKCFPKNAYVSKIFPKSSGLFWPL